MLIFAQDIFSAQDPPRQPLFREPDMPVKHQHFTRYADTIPPLPIARCHISRMRSYFFL